MDIMVGNIDLALVAGCTLADNVWLVTLWVERQDFHSCYRTPGTQKGFRRVSKQVSEGVSEGFFKGFEGFFKGSAEGHFKTPSRSL